MVIALDSTIKKVLLTALAFTAAATYVGISATYLLASHFRAKENGHALELAVRLAPCNAEYHNRLGIHLFDEHQLQAAFQQFRLATYLNPHNAHYWFDLYNAGTALNHNDESSALRRALAADPKDPNLAWDAANNFLARGDAVETLREFRVVIEGAPNLAYASLQRCLHVADVDTILAQAVPAQPGPHLAFVDLLSTQKDSVGAAKAWEALVKLRQPINTDRALEYINYLVAQKDVAQAHKAWIETLQLNSLSAYLNGRDNLFVNPSFDADILNGGFDWQYRRHANVELALDPSDFHAGRRSLAISFDGPGISDAGIFQLIPVSPATDYQFSAYFKSDGIDGAGGPRLTLTDPYTNTNYFESDDLKNSEVWRQVAGQFKTATDTQLLVLRLTRVPADSPIRGKLWLDNFHLAEKQP